MANVKKSVIVVLVVGKIRVKLAVVDPDVLAGLDGKTVAAGSQDILRDYVANDNVALLPDEESNTVKAYGLLVNRHLSSPGLGKPT
jgi:hypothetical protein